MLSYLLVILIAACSHLCYIKSAVIVDANGCGDAISDSIPDANIGKSSSFSSLKLLSFSWSQCGPKSEAIQVKSFDISPDPILIPGTINVGFIGSIAVTENSPLQLSLVIEKKVLFAWIKMPCKQNVGSCTYPNVCKMLPNPCPKAFKDHNFNCTCPISAGNYNLPTSPAFNVSSSSIPDWLEDGDYWIDARIKDSKGNEILCIDFYVTLKKN